MQETRLVVSVASPARLAVCHLDADDTGMKDDRKRLPHGTIVNEVGNVTQPIDSDLVAIEALQMRGEHARRINGWHEPAIEQVSSPWPVRGVSF